MATEQTETTPPIGEDTKAQTPNRTSMAGAIQIFMESAKIYPGTYRTYRRMRSNPTIALARAAAMSPVRAAKWGVQSEEGVPDEWKTEIHEALKPLWSELIRNMLYGLDYGFQGFEKVFEIKNGMVQYCKLKPLLIDITDILIDKDNGDFAGFRQGKVILPADKSVIFTNDGEAGNLHGRSRDENCRKEWSRWDDLGAKSSQYVNKAAGVIPMIEYPEGMSFDGSGTETDNSKIAKQMLAELGQGHGVYMPNTMQQFANDLMRSGVDISQLKAWHISFLETKGQHGAEIVSMMRHLESLMMRGWLVPERSVLEGQHGTKSESEVHATLGLVVSYLLLLDMVDVINDQVVNPLLRFNHGIEAEGKVYVVPEELGSDEQVFFRELLKQVFAHPNNLDLFLSVLNVDSLLDIAGLPKSDMADISKAAAEAADRTASLGDMPPAATTALSGIYASLAAGRIGRGLTLE